jgi:uncharacterized protein (DUF433 family)
MTTTLHSHITSSPGTRGGKPLLAGTRITIADVVLLHLRLGQSLEQVAARYQLSLAAVHAAMAYYYDHRADIDRSLDDENAAIEAARQQNPSLLQAKLKASNGG